ncbi:Uncharacterised protein [Mycoplasmopsis bovigenitalium]|uniref:Uncharacterized protein n=2 Tax=Mycoplasmopsis bovigenitalium TaxID=2112 RepID=A0A449A9Q5_9BACT|nr:Uncharacterised protein [Mycoplasmopsis bovigenitalium]
MLFMKRGGGIISIVKIDVKDFITIQDDNFIHHIKPYKFKILLENINESNIHKVIEKIENLCNIDSMFSFLVPAHLKTQFLLNNLFNFSYFIDDFIENHQQVVDWIIELEN